MPSLHQDVNEKCQEWRQGDCYVGKESFLYRIDPTNPLQSLTSEVGGSELESELKSEVVAVEVEGFAVLTQTCDIVRESLERPYLEVAPLIQVNPVLFQEVKAARRPAYAHIPGVASRGLVADLDRIMTLEKSLLLSWERTPGCHTDQEARSLARCLARKRERFAFPDAFTEYLAPLTKKLKEKHEKQTPEGQALRALREIRVAAAPAWDATTVSVSFYFIRHEQTPDTFEGKPWLDYMEQWLSRLPPHPIFGEPEGIVTSLADMSAKEYVESDPLDLDHLSRRE